MADFGNKLQGEEAKVGKPFVQNIDQGLTALLNGGFQAAEDKANELAQAFVNTNYALRKIPGVARAEDNPALQAVLGVSALGVVKTVLPALFKAGGPVAGTRCGWRCQRCRKCH